jgi:hypothetical protein
VTIRIVKTLGTLLALSIGVPLLAGCAADSPTQPEPSPTPTVNAVKPNANARILSQATFGDPAKWSSLYELSTPYGSGCGFRGQLDGYTVVGHLGSSGNLQWSARLPYTLRQVWPLSPLCSVPGGMLVVGKHDTDGDGLSELGYGWLYSALGSMTDVETFSSDSSDVWVNAVATVSDTLFVVVGGERTPSRTNPLIATLALTESGDLVKRSQTVLTSMTNGMFTKIALDPAGPGGGHLALFVVSSVDVGEDHSIRVHKITVEYPSLASATLDWSQEIAGAGPSCWANDLAISGDHVYVCGGTDDATKTPPAAGGHWRSGLAARLTVSGEIDWGRTVRLSDRSEEFDVVVPTPDGVLFVGDGVRYVIVESKEVFGYGWIARLAPATGDVLASLTFGDEAFQSGFNAGFYEGGKLYCGGWTHEEMEGGTYRAWFCAIDASTGPAAAAPARLQGAPTSVRMGDPGGRRSPPG